MAELYRGVTKWIVLLTLPIIAAILLFPRLIISATFGSKYLAGATALQLLVLSYVVSSFAGPNIKTHISLGETRLHMHFNAAAAAVNVTLNVVLIPRFGLLGAAASTVISLILLDVLVSVRLYQRAGLHPFSRLTFLPAAFGAGTIGILYVGVVAVLDTSPLAAVAMFTMFAPIYVAGILRFGGIEEQEIMIVESIEDRFDVDLETVKQLAQRLS